MTTLRENIMKAPYRHHEVGMRNAQHGVVLFVVLIMLVVLTLLGMSLYGTTSVEEKMARNYRDSEVANQAADAALRDAEIRISGYYVYATQSTTATPIPIDNNAFNSSCDYGLCDPTVEQPVDKKYSMTASPSVALGDCPGAGQCNGSGGGGSTTDSPAIVGVAAQPRYLVERIPWTPTGTSVSDGGVNYAYRVTAVGYGRSDTTRVFLQEIFIP